MPSFVQQGPKSHNRLKEAEVIHSELAVEFVSYCDDYIKWEKIEVRVSQLGLNLVRNTNDSK